MNKNGTRNIVLVVDDSPETLRMLTDAIEEAGMTVLVARESEHALSIIEKVLPDVILIVPGELLARIRVHLANARIAHSARTALDAFGRFLLAASHTGRVLWCTPQAARLLGTAFRDFDTDGYVLPRKVQDWLHQCAAAQASPEPSSIELKSDAASMKLQLLYVGQIGPDENLLRLLEGDAGNDQTVLKQKLLVTEREAEVLLWIARGKSNRDIAEILTLSPRTVNKHLEQIYAKLGVENRTSAAALAVRTLGVR